ncbi:MAG: hypothetical protein HRT86_14735, partial [Ilumatobacteraceae bacterium]|nr:hypothetical protein [Ilumatobacteraceae bacterium]
MKLVAEEGSITIEPGSDAAFGISAGGDILLEARGSNHDVIVNGNLQSVTGHVTLTAVDDIDLNGSLSTGGDGTVYLLAGNDQVDAVGPDVDGINLNGSITTADGDVLIDSGEAIRQTALIQSDSGDIGLVADTTISQTAGGDITTGGDLLIDAGGDWTMDGDAVFSVGGQDLLGQSDGTITLGVLQLTDTTTNRVAISAAGDILDGNGNAVNIAETDGGAQTSLSLRAGGIIGGLGGAVASVNDNAIDLNVDQVAATSATGIYLREVESGGAITVTSVDEVSVTIDNVERADFDSATTDVSLATVTIASLEDLQTSSDGPIKLVAEGGSITVEAGNDTAFGISADGTGDLLLEARGAESDVIVNGNLVSGSGHITLDAGRNVDVNATLSTTGAGTVVILSGVNTEIDAEISTIDGDLLASANGSITQTASITSTNGDVGLVAGGRIDQTSTGDITTTDGDVLIDAGGDWTMAADTVIEAGGQDLLGQSGGTITLGVLRMTDAATNRVALEAAGDILDANAAAINIEESVAGSQASVSLRSGGVIGGAGLTSSSTNDAAIDLVVDVVAAASVLGIYLREVSSASGDIRVDTAAAVSVDVDGVLRSNFNSTTSDASQDASLASLEDLVSTEGPVKLVAEEGSITIEPGSDAAFGISAGGDILLEARG